MSTLGNFVPPGLAASQLSYGLAYPWLLRIWLLRIWLLRSSPRQAREMNRRSVPQVQTVIIIDHHPYTNMIRDDQ